jgi:hypothetical protein
VPALLRMNAESETDSSRMTPAIYLDQLVAWAIGRETAGPAAAYLLAMLGVTVVLTLASIRVLKRGAVPE